MKNPIETVALLVLLVFIGVPTLGMAVADAPLTPHSIANESVAVSTTNWTSVSADGVSYADNETVYYNGSVVPQSEYDWSTANGSIMAVSGGQLDGANSVDISYTYYLRQRGVRLWKAANGIFLVVLGPLLIVAAVGVVMGGLYLFSGGSGGMR